MIVYRVSHSWRNPSCPIVRASFSSPLRNTIAQTYNPLRSYSPGVQLKGAEPDLSAATYQIHDESHTIGNALRWMLMKKYVFFHRETFFSTSSLMKSCGLLSVPKSSFVGTGGWQIIFHCTEASWGWGPNGDLIMVKSLSASGIYDLPCPFRSTLFPVSEASQYPLPKH